MTDLNDIHQRLCAIKNAVDEPNHRYVDGDLDVPLQLASFNLIVVHGQLPLHTDEKIIGDIQTQAPNCAPVNEGIVSRSFHRMMAYYVGTQVLAISPQPMRALLENETVSATVLQGGIFELDIRKSHGVFTAPEYHDELWWCLTYDRVDGWPVLTEEQMMRALVACVDEYARIHEKEELLA